MKYYGLALDLKDDPELVEQYKAHHRAPWPEPLQGLAEVGVVGMKIFLLGRRMFMYLEAEDDFDMATAFAEYARKTPKAGEWDALMRTFQKKAPGAGPDEWWALMEPVFDLHDHLPDTERS